MFVGFGWIAGSVTLPRMLVEIACLSSEQILKFFHERQFLWSWLRKAFEEKTTALLICEP
jgi:hypothetical protein